jgi:hypothetical protein
MPIAALWSLVVGLALLALGLAYKIGELTHRVDRINKEAETLRSELDALQKSKDKEISDIKELHQRETEELRNKLETAIHKTTSTQHNFCFIDNGNLKWKAYLDSGSVYDIEDAPYCVKHDLQLLYFNGGYVCSHINEDGCEAQLKDSDHHFRKEYVETLAERQFRQTKKV